MMFAMPKPRHASQLLAYLSSGGFQTGDRLPPIPELAELLGISSSKLREQLEVARVLGFVEVRPKTGIRTKRYEFAETIRTSLAFAVTLDPRYFVMYSKFRSHVEESFWKEAVQRLEQEDIDELKTILARAWAKLHANPVRIPHEEHRQLHLAMYKRINNTFVSGVLEAYWEGYEAIGLNVFNDMEYLESIWTYHQTIVDSIEAKAYDAGQQALVEHMQMLEHRPDLGQKIPDPQPSE